MGNILSCGMSISHMCSTPRTEQCTHLHIVHHLRHVLVTYQRTLLIWSLEGKMTPMDVMTGQSSVVHSADLVDSPRSTRAVGEKSSLLQGST